LPDRPKAQPTNKEDVMRKQYLLINTLAVWLATITNAYAAETTKVYSSGILVLIFIGFCALVVVAQLIPAILVLMGVIKGFVKGSKEKPIEVEANK